MKLLIADQIGDDARDGLAALGLDVIDSPEVSVNALSKALAGVDILVVGDMGVPRKALEKADNLRLIVRAGSGTEGIDVETASERAIFVSHCPNHDAGSRSEHAVGELVSLDRMANPVGLAGRTLGLVGFTPTAEALAEAAVALGMSVHVHAPTVSVSLAADLALVLESSLESMLEQCDVVSLHPDPETPMEVTKESLKHLRDDSLVLACEGVAGLDLKALHGGITKRGIRASLDQSTSGLSSADEELLSKIGKSKRARVTATAGESESSRRAAALEVIRIVHGFLYHGEVTNCVNIHHDREATCTLVVKHKHETSVLADLMTLLSDEKVSVHEIRNTLFLGDRAAQTHLRLASLPGPGLLSRLRKKETIYDASVEHI